MVWPSRSLVKCGVFIVLPIFSIVAASLYFYHRKEKDLDDYSCDKEFWSLEVKIPNQSISLVIGRGGENIRNIQAKTNTRINFKTAEADQDYRICRIRGKREDTQLAEQIILEMLNTQKNTITYEMEVPQKSCGRIIGRCGDNIRSISKASKCVITVDRMGAPTSSHRLVTIRGTEDQIAVAKQMIEEKIAEDEEARNRMHATLSSRSPRLKNKNKKYEVGDNKVPSYEKLITSTNDSMLQVYVSAVADPTHFWLQLISPRAVELDHLVDNMTEYYENEENRKLHKLNEVSLGQIVACRVAEDNKWYRVEVCSHEPYREDNRDETTIDVFYVDYGDSAYIKLGDLYQLRADFLSLRFQAIECAMDGIFPNKDTPADKWDEETVEMFEDMVYVGQWKAISAQVVRYKPREKSNRREGSPVPCVKLYDPDGPPGVDIGQQLINKGVAKAAPSESEDDKEVEDSRNEDSVAD
ncbi:hypothetical protein O3M35_009566 [Rhynocoris fuscipes]|uniref:Tudor domain-containing protein n=1 Tax=Rhynocoris fuscipes TaxID=488301 RepID=A0AAW1D647_9HEMI